MKFHNLARQTEKLVQNNTQNILIGIGISGTVTTAYLAGKASFDAFEHIWKEDGPKTTKEKIKIAWKFYIPAAISGAITIGCIIGGAKAASRKTAAAYSLLSASEQVFMQYKDKVIEKIGENKERAIRDDVAKDNVNKAVSDKILVIGSGDILCYEAHTGRLFQSDMETLRKAENDINALMLRENEAHLSDFYHMVGLPYTSECNFHGWTSDKLMALIFSTIMSDDGRPCISFEYNYVKPL